MSWRKGELKIRSNGYYDLAAAVIKQWAIDGKPRGDITGVSLWKELLESHRKMMNDGLKHGTISGVKLKR